MKSTPVELTEFLKAGNRIFYVPVFQRRYDWDENHCEVLFNDIYQTTIRNSEETDSVEHFIGSIVYVEEKGNKHQTGKVILTDGQQRISTTLLFLAALRDVSDDEELKNDLMEDYLTVTLPKQKDHPYSKLKQVELDGDVFKHLMLNQPVFNEEKDSRIYRNYEYFIKQLQELKETGFDLSDLLHVGLDGFNLVAIQLEPKSNAWENPQDIFESMNSLGKPLSLGDLVRNYLLLQQDFDNQEKLYSYYWIPVEKKIEDDPSAFIRDYMQMVDNRWFKQSNTTNAKVLYSDFKSVLGNEDPEALLTDMSFYADIYAWITLKKEPKNAIVSRVLKDLADMKANSAQSMIMFLLGEWVQGNISDSEIEQILLILRSYFLRRRILKSSNAENKGIPALQPRIREEVLPAEDKIQTLLDVLGEQEETMAFPSDQKIKRELLNMNFFSSSYCLLILSMVEEAMTKSRPVKDGNLQIEHIMPRTINSEWRLSLGPDADRIHDELVHNLGNLTLIRHNQELGNKPFPEKKEVYSNNAGMEIAKKHIIDCDNWGEDQIRERADWLSNFIIHEVVPTPEGLKINRPRFKQKNFSFSDYNLIGKTIYWEDDPSVTAVVINDKKVKFEGKTWSLSGLTRELHTRNGTVNKSGSYNGYFHWLYDGKLLGKMTEPVE